MSTGPTRKRQLPMSIVFLIFALILVPACGGGSAGNPGDAVTNLFEAFQAGDGERAVSYLSDNVIEEMAGGLEELKADPESAAEQLTSFGVEVSADELVQMDAREFAALIMSSPMIAGMMEAAEVEVGEAVVEGNRATVMVTVRFMGDETTEEVPLIQDEGTWKVDGEFGFSF